MSQGKEAPVFVDAYRAAQLVATCFRDHPSPLAARFCAQAVALVEHVQLAVKGHDRRENLETADRLLVRLRIAARLTIDVHPDLAPRMRQVLVHLDDVGRQVGGWLRSGVEA